jgi:hypothetical protein
VIAGVETEGLPTMTNGVGLGRGTFAKPVDEPVDEPVVRPDEGDLLLAHEDLGSSDRRPTPPV